MCGIGGIVSINGKPVNRERLKAMTDVISHRGPDDQGHWYSASQSVGFGHRRLSIIDLSPLGHQPMEYSNGRFVITFNGEIYNYIELRNELIKSGYKFYSDSDTEVLLALFEQKGSDCLNDLDGMFSFAIWDNEKKELFAARDFFGEKPFHYYFDGDEFIFGSEIKQFWKAGVERKISKLRLMMYMGAAWPEDPYDKSTTFFDNIKQLPPGHKLLLKQNGKLSVEQYYKVKPQSRIQGISEAEAKDAFRDILLGSIERRLRADVPVGSSLSGGLDSSCLVHFINEMYQGKREQHTFTARFKDPELDEWKYVETLTKVLNVHKHSIFVEEGQFLSEIDKVFYHQDEPFGGASMVAQWEVMKLAKQNNITVLIDGQGSDEMLGGYRSAYVSYLSSLEVKKSKSFEAEVKAYNEFIEGRDPYVSLQNRTAPVSIKSKIGVLLGRKIVPYYFYGFNDSYIKNVDYTPYKKNVNADLSQTLLDEIYRMGLGQILRSADRNSMAHSREVRLPFLNKELIEFAFTLPESLLLNKGWTKYILRQVMNDAKITEEITWKKKKLSFRPPQEEWMKNPEIIARIDKTKKFMLDNGIQKQNVDFSNWRYLMAGKLLELF